MSSLQRDSISMSDRPLEGSLVLGRYRILRALARGGMGMVYLGRIEGAAGFSKPVVVKRVLSNVEDGEKSRQQFVREARILSNLSHPGIVGVIDFAEEGDAYLMVLEYVHGYQLGHWLRYIRGTQRDMQWELAVLVVIRVLQALHHAHTFRNSEGELQEIVHRDISPGNILVDLDGNVRLLDFGIARSKGDTGEYKTEEGVLKGKLPYIAPEMYHNAEATVSSDVYACAVVLYQLLAGKNPFVGKGMSDTVNRVLKLQPDPVSTLRPEVPFDLDDILQRGLEKKPEYRYATAQEFCTELYSLLRRPEAELAQRLREQVKSDFTGDMPDKLKVHRLSELEHTWRAAAQEVGAGQSLLRASTPPPPPPELGEATVDLQGSAIRDRQEMETALIPQDVAASLRANARVPQEMAPTAAPAAMSSRKLVVAVIGAALLAAAVAVGAVLALTDEPANDKPRFLVVDRQSEAAQQDSAPRDPQAEAAQPDTEGAGDEGAGDEGAGDDDALGASKQDQPSQGEPTRSGSAPEVDGKDPNSLTSAFARRQAAVQSCFGKHADSLEGSPQVSVRFVVAANGEVEQASLSPSAVAETALGRCVLGVARSTNFGARDEPVAFSIPITARVVGN